MLRTRKLYPIWPARNAKLLWKAVSIFLIMALLIQEPAAYAGATPAIEKSPSAANRMIPEELGSIEKSFSGTSGKTMIYIQDAHDSLEAQENIAKMINHLVENHGVKTVFEEGHEGPVPTDEYFGGIKDPGIKEKLSYFFLDKLRLGGAEYAHINRKRDFNLTGVDDEALHAGNIKAYQEAAQVKEGVRKDLTVLQNHLKKLANQSFPKEIKEWLKLKERLDTHRLDLLDYLKRTRALLMDKYSVSKYPSISLMTALIESKNREAAEAVKAIDAKTLFREINALESDLADTFLLQAKDRAIFKYLKGTQLLLKLNEIEVTADEYSVMAETIAEINTQEIAQFIADTTKKPIALSKKWESNVHKAKRFYELAHRRDQALEKNLKRHAGKDKLSVLVFGGFHRSKIHEILRKQNYTVLTVTPKISSISKRHQEYYKQLMGVGHHKFETPLFVSAAARPLGVMRSESRYSPELLGRVANDPRIDWKSQLLARQIEMILETVRSEMQTSRIEELPAQEVKEALVPLREKPIRGLLKSRSEVRNGNGKDYRETQTVTSEVPETYKPVFEQIARELEEVGVQNPVLLLSGLPGSGKSHIAKQFKRYLEETGRHAFVLETDALLRVNRQTRFVLWKVMLLVLIAPIALMISAPHSALHEWMLRRVRALLADMGRVQNLESRLMDYFTRLKADPAPVNLENEPFIEGGIAGNPKELRRGTVIIIEGTLAQYLFSSSAFTKKIYLRTDPETVKQQFKERDVREGQSPRMAIVRAFFFTSNALRDRLESSLEEDWGILDLSDRENIQYDSRFEKPASTRSEVRTEKAGRQTVGGGREKNAGQKVGETALPALTFESQPASSRPEARNEELPQRIRIRVKDHDYPIKNIWGGAHKHWEDGTNTFGYSPSPNGGQAKLVVTEEEVVLTEASFQFKAESSLLGSVTLGLIVNSMTNVPRGVIASEHFKAVFDSSGKMLFSGSKKFEKKIKRKGEKFLFTEIHKLIQEYSENLSEEDLRKGRTKDYQKLASVFKQFVERREIAKRLGVVPNEETLTFGHDWLKLQIRPRHHPRGYAVFDPSFIKIVPSNGRMEFAEGLGYPYKPLTKRQAASYRRLFDYIAKRDERFYIAWSRVSKIWAEAKQKFGVSPHALPRETASPDKIEIPYGKKMYTLDTWGELRLEDKVIPPSEDWRHYKVLGFLESVTAKNAFWHEIMPNVRALWKKAKSKRAMARAIRAKSIRTVPKRLVTNELTWPLEDRPYPLMQAFAASYLPSFLKWIMDGINFVLQRRFKIEHLQIHMNASTGVIKALGIEDRPLSALEIKIIHHLFKRVVKKEDPGLYEVWRKTYELHERILKEVKVDPLYMPKYMPYSGITLKMPGGRAYDIQKDGNITRKSERNDPGLDIAPHELKEIDEFLRRVTRFKPEIEEFWLKTYEIAKKIRDAGLPSHRYLPTRSSDTVKLLLLDGSALEITPAGSILRNKMPLLDYHNYALDILDGLEIHKNIFNNAESEQMLRIVEAAFDARDRYESLGFVDSAAVPRLQKNIINGKTEMHLMDLRGRKIVVEESGYIYTKTGGGEPYAGNNREVLRWIYQMERLARNLPDYDQRMAYFWKKAAARLKRSKQNKFKNPNRVPSLIENQTITFNEGGAIPAKVSMAQGLRIPRENKEDLILNQLGQKPHLFIVRPMLPHEPSVLVEWDDLSAETMKELQSLMPRAINVEPALKPAWELMEKNWKKHNKSRAKLRSEVRVPEEPAEHILAEKEKFAELFHLLNRKWWILPKEKSNDRLPITVSHETTGLNWDRLQEMDPTDFEYAQKELLKIILERIREPGKYEGMKNDDRKENLQDHIDLMRLMIEAGLPLKEGLHETARDLLRQSDDNTTREFDFYIEMAQKGILDERMISGWQEGPANGIDRDYLLETPLWTMRLDKTLAEGGDFISFLRTFSADAWENEDFVRIFSRFIYWYHFRRYAFKTIQAGQLEEPQYEDLWPIAFPPKEEVVKAYLDFIPSRFSKDKARIQRKYYEETVARLKEKHGRGYSIFQRATAPNFPDEFQEMVYFWNAWWDIDPHRSGPFRYEKHSESLEVHTDYPSLGSQPHDVSLTAYRIEDDVVRFAQEFNSADTKETERTYLDFYYGLNPRLIARRNILDKSGGMLSESTHELLFGEAGAGLDYVEFKDGAFHLYLNLGLYSGSPVFQQLIDNISGLRLLLHPTSKVELNDDELSRSEMRAIDVRTPYAMSVLKSYYREDIAFEELLTTPSYANKVLRDETYDPEAREHTYFAEIIGRILAVEGFAALRTELIEYGLGKVHSEKIIQSRHQKSARELWERFFEMDSVKDGDWSQMNAILVDDSDISQAFWDYLEEFEGGILGLNEEAAAKIVKDIQNPETALYQVLLKAGKEEADRWVSEGIFKDHLTDIFWDDTWWTEDFRSEMRTGDNEAQRGRVQERKKLKKTVESVLALWSELFQEKQELPKPDFKIKVGSARTDNNHYVKLTYHSHIVSVVYSAWAKVGAKPAITIIDMKNESSLYGGKRLVSLLLLAILYHHQDAEHFNLYRLRPDGEKLAEHFQNMDFIAGLEVTTKDEKRFGTSIINRDIVNQVFSNRAILTQYLRDKPRTAQELTQLQQNSKTRLAQLEEAPFGNARSEARSRHNFDWERAGVPFSLESSTTLGTAPEVPKVFLDMQAIYADIQQKRGNSEPYTDRRVKLSFGTEPNRIDVHLGAILVRYISHETTRSKSKRKYKALIDLKDPSNALIFTYDSAEPDLTVTPGGYLFIYRGRVRNGHPEPGRGFRIKLEEDQKSVPVEQMRSHPLIAMFERRVLRNYYDDPINRMAEMKALIKDLGVEQPQSGRFVYEHQKFQCNFPNIKNIHKWKNLTWYKTPGKLHKPTAFLLSSEPSPGERYLMFIPMGSWIALYNEDGFIKEYPYGTTIGLGSDPHLRAFFDHARSIRLSTNSQVGSNPQLSVRSEMRAMEIDEESWKKIEPKMRDNWKRKEEVEGKLEEIRIALGVKGADLMEVFKSSTQLISSSVPTLKRKWDLFKGFRVVPELKLPQWRRILRRNVDVLELVVDEAAAQNKKPRTAAELRNIYDKLDKYWKNHESNKKKISLADKVKQVKKSLRKSRIEEPPAEKVREVLAPLLIKPIRHQLRSRSEVRSARDRAQLIYVNKFFEANSLSDDKGFIKEMISEGAPVLRKRLLDFLKVPKNQKKYLTYLVDYLGQTDPDLGTADLDRFFENETAQKWAIEEPKNTVLIRRSLLWKVFSDASLEKKVAFFLRRRGMNKAAASFLSPVGPPKMNVLEVLGANLPSAKEPAGTLAAGFIRGSESHRFYSRLLQRYLLPRLDRAALAKDYPQLRGKLEMGGRPQAPPELVDVLSKISPDGWLKYAKNPDERKYIVGLISELLGFELLSRSENGGLPLIVSLNQRARDYAADSLGPANPLRENPLFAPPSDFADYFITSWLRGNRVAPNDASLQEAVSKIIKDPGFLNVVSRSIMERMKQESIGSLYRKSAIFRSYLSEFSLKEYGLDLSDSRIVDLLTRVREDTGRVAYMGNADTYRLFYDLSAFKDESGEYLPLEDVVRRFADTRSPVWERIGKHYEAALRAEPEGQGEVSALEEEFRKRLLEIKKRYEADYEADLKEKERLEDTLREFEKNERMLYREQYVYYALLIQMKALDERLSIININKLNQNIERLKTQSLLSVLKAAVLDRPAVKEGASGTPKTPNPRSEVRTTKEGFYRDGFILSLEGEAAKEMEALAKNTAALERADIPEWDAVIALLNNALHQLTKMEETPQSDWDKKHLPELAAEFRRVHERLVRLKEADGIYLVPSIVKTKKDFAFGFSAEDAILVSAELLEGPALNIAEILVAAAGSTFEEGSQFGILYKRFFPEFNPGRGYSVLKKKLRSISWERSGVRNGRDYHNDMDRPLAVHSGQRALFMDESDAKQLGMMSSNSDTDFVLYGDWPAIEKKGSKELFGERNLGGYSSNERVLYRILLDREQGIVGTWGIPDAMRDFIRQILESAGKAQMFVPLTDFVMFQRLHQRGFPGVAEHFTQPVTLEPALFAQIMKHHDENRLKIAAHGDHPDEFPFDQDYWMLRALARRISEGEMEAHFRTFIMNWTSGGDQLMELLRTFSSNEHEWFKRFWDYYLGSQNTPEQEARLKEYIEPFLVHYETTPVFFAIFKSLSSADPEVRAKALHYYLRLQTDEHQLEYLVSRLSGVNNRPELVAASAYVAHEFGQAIAGSRRDYSGDQAAIYFPEAGPAMPQVYFYALMMEEMRRRGGKAARAAELRIIRYSRALDRNAQAPGTEGLSWYTGLRSSIHRAFYREHLGLVTDILRYWLDPEILDFTGHSVSVRHRQDDLRQMETELGPDTVRRYRAILRAWQAALDEAGMITGESGEVFWQKVISYPEQDLVNLIPQVSSEFTAGDIDDVTNMIRLFYAFSEKYGSLPARIRQEIKGGLDPIQQHMDEEFEQDRGKSEWTAGHKTFADHIAELTGPEFKELTAKLDSGRPAEIFHLLTQVRGQIHAGFLRPSDNWYRAAIPDDADGKEVALEEKKFKYIIIQEVVPLERNLRWLGLELMPQIADEAANSIERGDLKTAVSLLADMGRFFEASGLGGVEFSEYLLDLEQGSLKPSQVYNLVRSIRTEVHKMRRRINGELRAAMAGFFDNNPGSKLNSTWIAKLPTVSRKMKDSSTGKEVEYEWEDLDPAGFEPAQSQVVDDLLRTNGFTLIEETLAKLEEVLKSADFSTIDEAPSVQLADVPLDQHFLRFAQSESGPSKAPLLLSNWSKKGLNLIRMAEAGLPVPPGVITSAKLTRQRELLRTPAFRERVSEEIERLRQYSPYPDLKLLIYARSGSAFMMPGLMMTIPNLGMNDQEAADLAAKTGDPWFAYHTYGELLRSFGIHIFNIPEAEFQTVLDVYAQESVSAEEMKKAVEGYKAIFERHDKALPELMIDQVMLAMEAVYDSWDAPTAVKYRNLKQISPEWGTVVILQKGVFGNLDQTPSGEVSGVGTAVLRTLPDGSEAIQGRFRIRAIGEELMTRTGNYIFLSDSKKKGAGEKSFGNQWPGLHQQLFDYARKLKALFGYDQFFEFTIERGKIWITQTNDDVMRDDYPEFENTEGAELLAVGHGASGGAVRGWVASTVAKAKELQAKFDQEKPDGVDGVILLVDRVIPEIMNDIPEPVHVVARELSVHAETLAQGRGITALYGLEEVMKFDSEAHQWMIGGRLVPDGALISIDGHENGLLYHDSGSIFLGSLPLKSAARSEARTDKAARDAELAANLGRLAHMKKALLLAADVDSSDHGQISAGGYYGNYNKAGFEHEEIRAYIEQVNQPRSEARVELPQEKLDRILEAGRVEFPIKDADQVRFDSVFIKWAKGNYNNPNLDPSLRSYAQLVLALLLFKHEVNALEAMQSTMNIFLRANVQYQDEKVIDNFEEINRDLLEEHKKKSDGAFEGFVGMEPAPVIEDAKALVKKILQGFGDLSRIIESEEFKNITGEKWEEIGTWNKFFVDSLATSTATIKKYEKYFGPQAFSEMRNEEDEKNAELIREEVERFKINVALSRIKQSRFLGFLRERGVLIFFVLWTAFFGFKIASLFVGGEAPDKKLSEIVLERENERTIRGVPIIDFTQQNDPSKQVSYHEDFIGTVGGALKDTERTVKSEIAGIAVTESEGTSGEEVKVKVLTKSETYRSYYTDSVTLRVETGNNNAEARPNPDDLKLLAMRINLDRGEFAKKSFNIISAILWALFWTVPFIVYGMLLRSGTDFSDFFGTSAAEKSSRDITEGRRKNRSEVRSKMKEDKPLTLALGETIRVRPFSRGENEVSIYFDQVRRSNSGRVIGRLRLGADANVLIRTHSEWLESVEAWQDSHGVWDEEALIMERNKASQGGARHFWISDQSSLVFFNVDSHETLWVDIESVSQDLEKIRLKLRGITPDREIITFDSTWRNEAHRLLRASLEPPYQTANVNGRVIHFSTELLWRWHHDLSDKDAVRMIFRAFDQAEEWDDRKRSRGSVMASEDGGVDLAMVFERVQSENDEPAFRISPIRGKEDMDKRRKNEAFSEEKLIASLAYAFPFDDYLNYLVIQYLANPEYFSVGLDNEPEAVRTRIEASLNAEESYRTKLTRDWNQLILDTFGERKYAQYSDHIPSNLVIESLKPLQIKELYLSIAGLLEKYLPRAREVFEDLEDEGNKKKFKIMISDTENFVHGMRTLLDAKRVPTDVNEVFSRIIHLVFSKYYSKRAHKYFINGKRVAADENITMTPTSDLAKTTVPAKDLAMLFFSVLLPLRDSEQDVKLTISTKMNREGGIVITIHSSVPIPNERVNFPDDPSYASPLGLDLAHHLAGRLGIKMEMLSTPDSSTGVSAIQITLPAHSPKSVASASAALNAKSEVRDARGENAARDLKKNQTAEMPAGLPSGPAGKSEARGQTDDLVDSFLSQIDRLELEDHKRWILINYSDPGVHDFPFMRELWKELRGLAKEVHLEVMGVHHTDVDNLARILDPAGGLYGSKADDTLHIKEDTLYYQLLNLTSEDFEVASSDVLTKVAEQLLNRWVGYRGLYGSFDGKERHGAVLFSPKFFRDFKDNLAFYDNTEDQAQPSLLESENMGDYERKIIPSSELTAVDFRVLDADLEEVKRRYIEKMSPFFWVSEPAADKLQLMYLKYVWLNRMIAALREKNASDHRSEVRSLAPAVGKIAETFIQSLYGPHIIASRNFYDLNAVTEKFKERVSKQLASLETPGETKKPIIYSDLNKDLYKRLDQETQSLYTQSRESKTFNIIYPEELLSSSKNTMESNSVPMVLHLLGYHLTLRLSVADAHNKIRTGEWHQSLQDFIENFDAAVSLYNEYLKKISAKKSRQEYPKEADFPIHYLSIPIILKLNVAHVFSSAGRFREDPFVTHTKAAGLIPGEIGARSAALILFYFGAHLQYQFLSNDEMDFTYFGALLMNALERLKDPKISEATKRELQLGITKGLVPFARLARGRKEVYETSERFDHEKIILEDVLEQNVVELRSIVEETEEFEKRRGFSLLGSKATLFDRMLRGFFTLGGQIPESAPFDRALFAEHSPWLGRIIIENGRPLSRFLMPGLGLKSIGFGIEPHTEEAFEQNYQDIFDYLDALKQRGRSFPRSEVRASSASDILPEVEKKFNIEYLLDNPQRKGTIAMPVAALGGLSDEGKAELIKAISDQNVQLILHSNSKNIAPEVAAFLDQLEKFSNVVVVTEGRDAALARWGLPGVAVDLFVNENELDLRFTPGDRITTLKHMRLKELGDILLAKLVATIPEEQLYMVQEVGGVTELLPGYRSELQEYRAQQAVAWSA